MKLSKGIEHVLFLDQNDRSNIIEFERKDEQEESMIFGKKNNVGVRDAFGCDVTIAFLTNKEFQWPIDNLKLIRGGKVVGMDVTDEAELQRYNEDNRYCVLGNIVVFYDDFFSVRDLKDPLYMVIEAKPFPSIEVVPGISSALIASPSRSSDEYIRSLYLKEANEQDSNKCVGSFLLGFNLSDRFDRSLLECDHVRRTAY